MVTEPTIGKILLIIFNVLLMHKNSEFSVMSDFKICAIDKFILLGKIVYLIVYFFTCISITLRDIYQFCDIR